MEMSGKLPWHLSFNFLSLSWAHNKKKYVHKKQLSTMYYIYTKVVIILSFILENVSIYTSSYFHLETHAS